MARMKLTQREQKLVRAAAGAMVSIADWEGDLNGLLESDAVIADELRAALKPYVRAGRIYQTGPHGPSPRRDD